MIVTCPSCSARYKFDEAKLKGRAAKITCPKCAHKFLVRPPAEAAPPAEEEEPETPEEPVSSGGGTAQVRIGASAAPPSSDIFSVDFRKLGVTWQVRRGLGLTYEFHTLKQLHKMLDEEQVAPRDSITWDGKGWRSIETIPDIEAYFEE